MARQKKIVIIAGPNGAGKTTFAREFLPREAECPDLINTVYQDLVNSWVLYDNSGPTPGRVTVGDNP